jgi:hypothetical protein
MPVLSAPSGLHSNAAHLSADTGCPFLLNTTNGISTIWIAISRDLIHAWGVRNVEASQLLRSLASSDAMNSFAMLI